ncbi:hypothetical protein PR048_031856 [Dryococelus australis]|uniref:Reverse transcriptase domain-containing protein n=1 Tax=Dryococelus australis TaxID=614101 RepID=A0ABQ9G995_9NEOP|nr:hypothetical protein PR048_031856 [Dryococelus australis]
MRKVEALIPDRRVVDRIGDFLRGAKAEVESGGGNIGGRGGVPEGRVLCPLLFTQMVHDMGLAIRGKIRLFAEDCVVYAEVGEGSGNLQADIDKNQFESRTPKLVALALLPPESNISDGSDLCDTKKDETQLPQPRNHLSLYSGEHETTSLHEELEASISVEAEQLSSPLVECNEAQANGKRKIARRMVYDYVMYGVEDTLRWYSFAPEEEQLGMSGKVFVALCKTIPNPQSKPYTLEQTMNFVSCRDHSWCSTHHFPACQCCEQYPHQCLTSEYEVAPDSEGESIGELEEYLSTPAATPVGTPIPVGTPAQTLTKVPAVTFVPETPDLHSQSSTSSSVQTKLEDSFQYAMVRAGNEQIRMSVENEQPRGSVPNDAPMFLPQIKAVDNLLVRVKRQRHVEQTPLPPTHHQRKRVTSLYEHDKHKLTSNKTKTRSDLFGVNDWKRPKFAHTDDERPEPVASSSGRQHNTAPPIPVITLEKYTPEANMGMEDIPPWKEATAEFWEKIRPPHEHPIMDPPTHATMGIQTGQPTHSSSGAQKRSTNNSEQRQPQQKKPNIHRRLPRRPLPLRRQNRPQQPHPHHQ